MRHRYHSERLRSGRVSAAWETYCLTKCTAGRRPILQSPPAADALIGTLAFVRQQGVIKLQAFVVLPDHYHALVTLLPGSDLAGLMRRVSSFTARRIREVAQQSGPIWQEDGFHDHRCRDIAEVKAYMEYIHHNPVRKGLAAIPEDWPFSSAHASRRHLLDWDWWS
jgi:REP element-mobilizing transposase RayT